MIVPSKIDLVDWPILFAPISELDKAILFRDVWYRTDQWVT